eukprot:3820900-Pyramimonas_sp.AAC.1
MSGGGPHQRLRQGAQGAACGQGRGVAIQCTRYRCYGLCMRVELIVERWSPALVHNNGATMQQRG